MMPIWSRGDNGFSAEASMLSMRSGYHPTSILNGNAQDPWNRDLLRALDWETHKDNEGDIRFWTAFTTVAGRIVELTIFND